MSVINLKEVTFLLRLLLLIIPVIGSSRTLQAQVRFIAEADVQRITQNDYISIQYTIYHDGVIRQFIPPRFTSFRIVKGPEQYTGHNPRKGDTMQYTTFRFILAPLKTGKLQVPAATLILDSARLLSNALNIEVLPSSTTYDLAHPKVIPEEFVLGRGESIQEKLRNNLFVKLDVDKTECFLGEPLIATYKLYTRLKSESRVIKRPGFSGFSVVDMADIESEIPVKERYKGRDYNVYLLRKVQLYPLQTGVFELETIEVLNAVTFVNAAMVDRGYNLSSLVDAFIEDKSPAGTTIQENITLTSEPRRINVKPLPVTGSPRLFSGAVGSFTLESHLDKDHLRARDVANLQLIIRGKGNFSMIGMPVVDWPDSIEIFEPVIKETLNKYLAPTSGSLIFTIPFSPKTEGRFKIPAVSFNYFDPESKKYKETKTDTLDLLVDPPSAMAPLTAIGEKERTGGTDFVRVKMLLLVLAVTGFFLGAWIWYQKMKKKIGVPAKGMGTVKQTEELQAMPEQAQAVKSGNDYLIMLHEKLDQSDARAFYRLLEDLLFAFAGDRYGIRGYTNPAQISRELQRRGIEPDKADIFYQLLTECEMALYTPVDMQEKMIETFKKAEKLLGET